MTAPVPPPVLSTRHSVSLAARRRLAAVPGLLDVLGPSKSWLFVDQMQVVVEGSGSAAAVLRMAGSWGRPNAHNTARFPRLSVEIYADYSRGSATSAQVTVDAEARAHRAFEPFREFLHRPTGFSEVWGATASDPGLRVWGSQLLEEPEVFDVPDFVGGKRLQGYFGLNVG